MDIKEVAEQHQKDAKRLSSMVYVPPEQREREKEKEKEKEKVDHTPAYCSIAREVKGLVCKDIFFAYPAAADFNLINAYQDHLITIEEYLNVLKGAGPIFKKDAGQVIFMRLRSIMREMKEKVIDPAYQGAEGEAKKTITEQAGKWNDQVRALEKVGEALDDQRYDFKALKVELSSSEEKTA